MARVTAENMGRMLGQHDRLSRTSPALAARWAAIGSFALILTAIRFLLHHLGLATAVTLYRKLPFDPTTDLKPVGVVSDANMAIIARPDTPEYAGRSRLQTSKPAGDQ